MDRVTVTGPAGEDTALEGVTHDLLVTCSLTRFEQELWRRWKCEEKEKGKVHFVSSEITSFVLDYSSRFKAYSPHPESVKCCAYRLNGRLHQFGPAHSTFTATVFKRTCLCILDAQTSPVVSFRALCAVLYVPYTQL